MLDSVKKFDNLKFKQKLILVYCISLITSLFLSICLLVVFCINILKDVYKRQGQGRVPWSGDRPCAGLLLEACTPGVMAGRQIY